MNTVGWDDDLFIRSVNGWHDPILPLLEFFSSIRHNPTRLRHIATPTVYYLKHLYWLEFLHLLPQTICCSINSLQMIQYVFPPISLFQLPNSVYHLWNTWFNLYCVWLLLTRGKYIATGTYISCYLARFFKAIEIFLFQSAKVLLFHLINCLTIFFCYWVVLNKGELMIFFPQLSDMIYVCIGEISSKRLLNLCFFHICFPILSNF